MNLATAIDLVIADLLRTNPRLDGLDRDELLDFARNDIEDAEIDDALAQGEISSATATAYDLIWNARHRDLTAALAAAAA